MSVCASARPGGPTHLPSSPRDQDWTSSAGCGWEGQLRLTSHLNQGCIELEMDEVAAETGVGTAGVSRLVHSHPPSPPRADGIVHLPKDADLLQRRLRMMKKQCVLQRQAGFPVAQIKQRNHFKE